MTALAGLALGGLVAPAFGGPPEDFAAAESAAFAEADSNGDGVLSVDEFVNFHELMRRKLDALSFNRIDANGDGGITLDELKAARPIDHPGPPPGPGF
ncbi:MAG TPA: EF-hand domain-containing protein [Candidatus Kryptonia bacterium]|nr:EF-hand domain-containing protein [Candidatus Kryptonia bacterium]